LLVRRLFLGGAVELLVAGLVVEVVEEGVREE
jgi:hypothetical protein